MSKSVKFVDVDLYEYHPNFGHDYTDLQVTTEYIDSRNFFVVITRLDKPAGWNETLQVLVYYRKNQIHQIITVDPSPEISQQKVQIQLGFDIYESLEPTKYYPAYSLVEKDAIAVEPISKSVFEDMFHTEIYTKLPDNMYAVGLMDGKIYMYNERFGSYYEIIHNIKLIARIFFTYYPKEIKYHFLICSNDGYFERHYLSERTISRRWTDADYNDGQRVHIDDPKEYPLLYSGKWIFGMSNHWKMPYTIDIIDRHYLYCNLYNSFRSFHRGIPFREKIDKIIFACRVSRSSKYNFLPTHANIEMSQREYFYSDAVSKENIVCEREKWIDNREMVDYKYILDVDGNASTWDATAWKLNSGSVIFKTKSPWRQWFYDDYLPWVHYIPIADDFSDLQEKYQWCECHMLECERMIIRCKDLFQKTFRFSNIIEYVLAVIEKTRENMS